MKAEQIQEKLKHFVDNPQYRGMLIDGAWGIGKTYQIGKFLKAYEEERKNNKEANLPNICYFSIYGTESVVAFNDEVYKKLHPAKNFMKEAYRMVNLSVNAVAEHASFGVSLPEGVNFGYNPNDKKDLKKEVILIIDDVERFGGEDFGPFLGLINKYFLEGARVVCICSLDHLAGERQKTLNQYKEKMFDLVYKIDEPGPAIFDGYFRNIVNDEEKKELLDVCQHNLRTLIRASLLYEEIKKAAEEIDESKKFVYAKVCCYAVRIALGRYEPRKKDKDAEIDDMYPDTYAEHLEEKFGKTVSNNFEAIRDEWKKEGYLEFDFSDAVYHAVIFFFLSDPKEVIPLFRPYINSLDPDDITLLKHNYFYLSDSRKNEYLQTLERTLKDPDVPYDEFYVNKIGNLITSDGFVLKDDFVDALVKKMFSSGNPGTIIEIYEDFVYSVRMDSRSYSTEDMEKVNAFIDKVKKSLEIQLTDLFKKELAKSAESRSWFFVLRYKEYKGLINEKEIAKFLENNRFFLPNLQGEISEKDWTFSKEMGIFARKRGYGQSFKDLILDLSKEDDKDKSFQERLYFLIMATLNEGETYNREAFAKDKKMRKE